MATTFGLEMHPARNIPMCVIPSVNLLICTCIYMFADHGPYGQTSCKATSVSTVEPGILLIVTY